MLSVAKSLGIVNDFLPIVRERMYLAYRYFGQVKNRWWISSITFVQVFCGQYGVSIFRILCK